MTIIDISLTTVVGLIVPWQAQCWRAPDVVCVVVKIINLVVLCCSVNSYIVPFFFGCNGVTAVFYIFTRTRVGI